MYRWECLFGVACIAICLFLQSCGGAVSSAQLNPKISSEDSELDHGGSDVPEPTDYCGLGNTKRFTLQVRNVENGALIQNGVNGPQNPAILDIGYIYGTDPTEPLTRINLDFVTDAPDLIVGADTSFYRVFNYLVLFDLSASNEFLSDYVANEPVYDQSQVWIGNRVATWNDDLAIFDGLANLNETYILQSCRGQLFQNTVGNVIGSSQPLYIQARLTGTY